MGHPVDPKEAEMVVEALIEKIGEDKFNEMRYQAYIYRIICSIYYADSADAKVLIDHITAGFDGMVEADQIADIVNKYLPHVLEDPDYYENGQLTDDAVMIAISHNKMMQLGYKRPASHPTDIKHLH